MLQQLYFQCLYLFLVLVFIFGAWAEQPTLITIKKESIKHKALLITIAPRLLDVNRKILYYIL